MSRTRKPDGPAQRGSCSARVSGLLAAAALPLLSGLAIGQELPDDVPPADPAAAAAETAAPPPPTPSGDVQNDDVAGESGNQFAALDLEALLQLQVTSVTGTRTSWFETPAAVTVLTADDIRRAGHRSIPEALRLVPGMHVARLDSGSWAISSRGFPGPFANKLQVLMDGRRLYDPLYSGVYWDITDTMMEDLEQIEVIRGPGATLWGANAVNGVINITTKSAADTHGVLITGGGGNVERRAGAVRYGAQLGDQAHIRIFTKYRDFNSFPSVDAGRRPDEWDMWQSGFRLDVGDPDETTLTLQGDIFTMPGRGTRSIAASPTGHLAWESVMGEDQASGGNVLARMRHQVSDSSHWTAQVYFDTLERTADSGFAYDRDTIDLDFRHHFALGKRHELVWGLGYRKDWLDSTPAPTLGLIPPEREIETVSAFVQDTITIVPERVYAMLGSKFEHNDFSGYEVQPSARLWWTPDDRQTFWGAFSRPVRTPSWIEQNMRLQYAYADPGLLAPPFSPTGTTIPLFLTGDSQIKAETVRVWEAGYRRRIGEQMTIDIAGFYNEYRDLVDVDLARGVFVNGATADTYGAEVSTTVNIAENWSVQGKYSFLQVDVGAAGSATADSWERGFPEHQFQFHSRLNLTDDLEFNGSLYWVDELAASEVDAYTRLDLGLTWRPRPNVELSIWGQNLLEGRHIEYNDRAFPLDSPAQVERSVFAQATIRF